MNHALLEEVKENSEQVLDWIYEYDMLPELIETGSCTVEFNGKKVVLSLHAELDK